VKWSAPKVVEDQIPKRGMGSKILIVLDGADVVEHETTAERVAVNHDSCGENDCLR
jgi:hypothetical protein